MGSILILAVALAAASPSPGEQPPLGGNDVTFRVVSGDNRFYPETAQRREIEGAATAVCVIGADGRLSDCQVLSEAPEGYNFGGATLKLMAALKIASKAKDGSPTAGRRFRFDMKFKLPR